MSIGRATRPRRPSSCSSMAAAGNAVRAISTVLSVLRLAAQGIVTVVPDYSIFPPARFPMFVEDAARAVRFARQRSPQWGGDPERLVLMGHSAGAYIAAMLSFDPRWLRQVGLNSQIDLSGLIGLAGPYDFLPIESRTLRTIFGGDNRPETQPIFFITGKEAPYAADHGMARSPSQSREQPQNGREYSRPWRCCRGTHLSRGRSSYVDRRLCARSASSGAGAARRYSIRLACHTAGRGYLQSPSYETRTHRHDEKKGIQIKGVKIVDRLTLHQSRCN